MVPQLEHELQQDSPAVSSSSSLEDQVRKTKSLISALNFVSRDLPLPPDLLDTVSSIYSDEIDADFDSGTQMKSRPGNPGISIRSDLMTEFEDALSNQRSNCMSGFALAELRENRYQSHILHRLNELEELSSTRGEDLQMKCLLELHGLKLAELQSKVRSEVSSEYWLHLNCVFPDKQLFDWGIMRLPRPLYGIGDVFATETDDQFRKKRDAERLSRLEEEERNLVETRKRKFFAEILNAVREFQLQVQATLKRRKQRNDGVQAWHGRQRQRATRAEKLRLQALKADDQEAYMRLVKESKNERLTMLLEETNKLLVNLGAAVQRQKDAKHSDGIEPLKDLDADSPELDASRNESPLDACPEEDEIIDSDINDDSGDLLEGQRQYNSAIHSIQEKVTEQPSILKGGRLRPYQLEGLQWMVSLFNNNLNGILADEMGLGKTIQTISLIAYLKETKGVCGPHLIVAPKAVLPNWINEFSTWIEENEITELADHPNYALAVLRLVAEQSIDEQIRHAASVNFKNHLRSRWAPSPDSSFTPILDSEKDQIKILIVNLMLNSTPRIQSQLSESLSLIGQHDFPKSWPTLLPELVSSLRAASQSNNYPSINGILGTANSIFKKFRYQYKTNDLLVDLKYCLDNFCAPLLEMFLRTAALIDSMVGSGGGSPVTLKPLFESQRLCCRIFYSLNFQELPEFFEDHMKEWMTEFKKYLANSYPVLESSVEGLGLVDDLRAAVCENISLYMEKNEEEFKDYLNDFAQAVWTLLGNVSQSSSRDSLAVMAIKFLTTVSTSVHHTLFAVDGVIPQICQSIVIPNVRLRDEDEELFEMNYIEFIRRDMEGSDIDTRRRIACELLKGIATNYKQQVISIVSVQIQNLLTSYAANPAANWKDKDCAVYLVVSLSTKKAGGNSVSTDLVDVQSFFGSVVVPELQSQDVNAFLMLKAGALKFFTMFRNQIPKGLALQLFPYLIQFLGSESNVVHSYAASCIEKLLLVKDEGGRSRYTSADVAPNLLVLINNLFTAFRFPESEENQYIMKSIMRVLGVAEITPEIAGPCIAGLTSILAEVCKNPKNPIFNHYLFESVAVLVRRACERDISLIPSFETSLFPILQEILGNDVTEFLPYTFQLLAQLVELNRPPISDIYMEIFKLLLSPDSWTRNSNVPALVRLLQAFLEKAPEKLNQEERLAQVLGIFNRLVSVPSTDEQGFFVLNTVIENLDYGAISPYVGHIWNALFTRLQSKRTVKYIKSLLIFMSLFLVKHGFANLVDSMNSVQAGIFSVILEQFWIPNLKLITGPIEVKLVSVASTRLICESLTLSDAGAARHWGAMLDSIVTLLSRPEEDRVGDEPEMPDITENTGYSVAFVNLYNAGRKEEDPLKDIKDPREFLATSLAKLSALSPGRFPQIISENLDPANQAALHQICSAYKCPVV